MTSPSQNAKPAPRHSLIEDILAFATGAAFAALGIVFLKYAKLVTGGATGLSLLLSQWADLPFTWVFLAVNLPFYLFGFLTGGFRLFFKSVAGMLAVAAASRLMPELVELGRADPVVCAVVGGLLLGVGMLILVRHGGSLGGLNILSLYIQDRWGFSAGKSQLLVDAAIIGATAFSLSASAALLSLLSVFAINLVMITNHKAGRYQGY